MTRAALALAVAREAGLPCGIAVALAASAQAIHEASLLLDDVNDRSPVRRGRPSAWARFGGDLATLAGVRLLATAQRQVLALASGGEVPVSVVDCMASTVERALDGQATELSAPARDWEGYDWIVSRKTGALIALPVALPMLAAGVDDERIAALSGLAHRIGVAYQMADDIRDGDLCGAGWASLQPSPEERLSRLLGTIRAEIAQSGDPLAHALRRVLDRLAG